MPNETPKSLKPLDLQRQQLDLERRTKELDARETYLLEREKLLDRGPLSIEILEETLKAKQIQIDRAKKDIESLLQEHDKVKVQLVSETTKIREAIREAKREKQSIDDEVQKAQQQLNQLGIDASDLKGEIQDRADYQKTQEKLIAESIDEGNAILRGIGYEVQTAQAALTTIKGDIAIVEKQKVDLTIEYGELDSKLMTGIDSAKATYAKLTQLLSDKESELSNVTAKALAVETNTAKKMKTLTLKEQELLAQQNAIRHDREELERDKRRWNSTKALYGDVN